MSFGADDYLTKPVIKDDLLGAIHARLKRRRLEDQRLQEQLDQRHFCPDFSSPAPLEAVVPTRAQRRLRCEVERRPGLAAVDVSLMLRDFMRPVPSETAAEMVGYRVRDSSTTSPALLMIRHVQSGRLGVE